MSKFERMMAQVAAIAIGSGLTFTAAVKSWSTQHDPHLTESEGGPRLTKHPQRGEGYGDGKKIEAKPGADEQNKFRWPWDDDDDFTGGSGASDEEPMHLGGVEPDWDAERMIAFGGVTFIVVFLVLGAAWALTRNNGSNARHAPAY